MKFPLHPPFRIILTFALVASALMLSASRTRASNQLENDPNRPSCTTAHCKAIESFVKSHYCGHSPAGNGPDNGCELLPPKKQPSGVEVIARFHCTFDESTDRDHCVQSGQPSAAVRNILMEQLRKAGLPENARGQIGVTVWKYRSKGWIVADAYYSSLVGLKVSLCQVIVHIDQDSHVVVLRKCPFTVKDADADTPDITNWGLVDVADVDGSGQPAIVLEGDAYEDHWFEVLRVHDGKCETIFSGLGYYL